VDRRYETVTLSVKLTRVLFHGGRCCKVIQPKEAKKYIISYIYSSIKFSEFSIFTTGFNFFLSDQKSAIVVQSEELKITGFPLKFSNNKAGLIKYKIRVSEEIHVESDPNFPCRNYNFIGEYNQCLEDEYTRQSREILNCTPPWMTDNQDIWCKQNIKLSTTNKAKSWFLLG